MRYLTDNYYHTAPGKSSLAKDAGIFRSRGDRRWEIKVLPEFCSQTQTAPVSALVGSELLSVAAF